jgi:mono/diheme cytochrome c family protein
MRRYQSKTIGRLSVLGVVAMVALLAACGGSSDEPAPVPAPTVEIAPTTPAVALTVAPTAVPTEEPAAEPIVEPVATPADTTTSSTEAPAGDVDEELFALGKEIFEETGGGVGCAWCHGMDGEGDGPSGMGAPANMGATADRLDWALEGGETDAMTFIELSSKEKKAVLLYLEFLGEK